MTRARALAFGLVGVLALASVAWAQTCPCYYAVSPPGGPVQYWNLDQPLTHYGPGAPGLYAYATPLAGPPSQPPVPCVTETSSSSAFASACFALDPTTQGQLSGLAATVALLGTFPGGAASYAYPDVNGVPVVFASVASFKAMYGGYVGYLQAQAAALAQGQPAPSSSVAVP